MDHKEAIMQAAIELIVQNDGHSEEITVREICNRAGGGLGLVNYHFGNKDRLMEQCIERMINGIVERFQHIQENTQSLTPFEKLEFLGNMTLDFLFEHCAVSRISILTDMRAPKDYDNTNRTYLAFLPLVAACRPDLDESGVRRKTFCLITVMQQMFLRVGTVSRVMEVDLTKKENRKAWHSQILHDILEV
ncbi:MAG: TetR/AcrR family transcriptional regulator [Lachnospiraceae bacterium]|jgi:AcrR family transcriptional regulator|nr:TetR/AcrR family transcriptional regulator [Lachnospiraceae bacterium]